MLLFRPMSGTPSAPVVASTQIVPSAGAWSIASAYVVRSMGIASSSLVSPTHSLCLTPLYVRALSLATPLTDGNQMGAIESRDRPRTSTAHLRQSPQAAGLTRP